MLIESTIQRQLDGRVGFLWKPSGLEGTIEIPQSVARSA